MASLRGTLRSSGAKELYTATRLLTFGRSAARTVCGKNSGNHISVLSLKCADKFARPEEGFAGGDLSFGVIRGFIFFIARNIYLANEH